LLIPIASLSSGPLQWAEAGHATAGPLGRNGLKARAHGTDNPSDRARRREVRRRLTSPRQCLQRLHAIPAFNGNQILICPVYGADPDPACTCRRHRHLCRHIPGSQARRRLCSAATGHSWRRVDTAGSRISRCRRRDRVAQADLGDSPVAHNSARPRKAGRGFVFEACS
jgi:hypothetical protein